MDEYLMINITHDDGQHFYYHLVKKNIAGIDQKTAEARQRYLNKMCSKYEYINIKFEEVKEIETKKMLLKDFWQQRKV